MMGREKFQLNFLRNVQISQEAKEFFYNTNRAFKNSFCSGPKVLLRNSIRTMLIHLLFVLISKTKKGKELVVIMLGGGKWGEENGLITFCCCCCSSFIKAAKTDFFILFFFFCESSFFRHVTTNEPCFTV